jgi:hypothetical protein
MSARACFTDMATFAQRVAMARQLSTPNWTTVALPR